MADLSVPNTFVDGAVITAAGHNQNNDAIKNYINDRNAGSSDWDNVKAAIADLTAATINTATISTATISSLVNTSASRVALTNSGTVAVSSAVIPFDTKTFDSLTEWSTATNTFTALNAGYYLVNFQASSSAGQIEGVSIYKNAAAVATSGYAGRTPYTVLSCGALVSLAAGETISFKAVGVVGFNAGEGSAFIVRIY